MSYNPETNKWEYDYKPPYNPGWTHSYNRRKHQRKLNKAMRLMNRSIENDPLWRGRFCVRSGKSRMYHYDDGSGAELLCELVFIDKKTGKTVTDYNEVNSWCWGHAGNIWHRMNTFITEDCDVWSENPNPYKDTVDYRNV